MIARSWSGCARVGAAESYLEHLESSVLPEIATIEGHRGAYVLRRDDRFVVITLWDSMACVEKFAGENLERAVVPVAARRHLAEFDESVVHYDIVHDSVSR